jgi:hypothetical protein
MQLYNNGSDALTRSDIFRALRTVVLVVEVLYTYPRTSPAYET